MTIDIYRPEQDQIKFPLLNRLINILVDITDHVINSGVLTFSPDYIRENCTFDYPPRKTDDMDICSPINIEK
jgi:hypothetical protein